MAAVGHNNGWLYEVRDPDFATMAADDLNLLSFWMASPWAVLEWGADRAPIENAEQGIGNYNQAACSYLDGVIAEAEGADVYLLPTIWSHDQLCDQLSWGAPSWWQNAYNSLCSAADFYLTGSSEQWRRQRSFYRYLMARWGHSRAIVGWVGVCEVDGTDGYYTTYGGSQSRVESWISEIRDYFAQNDAYRANDAGEYPMVFTKTDYYGDWSDWGAAAFDQRAVDSYASQNNSVAVAQTLATETMAMWGSGKPAFHAEWGAPSRALQPAHLHNGIWAATASGAALTPLLWCDGYDFPTLTDGQVGDAMRAQLKILAQFLAARDYLGDPGLAPATVGVASPCRGWTLKKADRGFAWIQNTAGTMGGQPVTIGGLASGDYTVEWYDVWTSGTAPIASETRSVAAGSLSLTIPALGQADTAVTFDGPANSVPVAADDAYSTDEDTELNVAAPGVLTNDTDGDGQALTAVLASAPQHGSLMLNADGSFAYTPDPGFHGTDAFTYRASDGVDLSNVATVTLTVNPVDDETIMHVLAVDVTIERAGSNTFGRAAVTIVDQNNAPVEGATVTIEWSDAISGTATGLTGPTGEAVIASPKIKKVTPGSTTFTATVTGVAKAGAIYDPGANVEYEGGATVPE